MRAPKIVATCLLILTLKATHAGAQALDGKTEHTVRLVLQGCLLSLDGHFEEGPIALVGVGTADSDDALKPREFYAMAWPAPLRAWVETSRIVLVSDSRARRDPQGKRLAYAMQAGGNRDWGWSLIRAGYAYARRDYEYDQRLQYMLAEAAARQERLGLWRNTEYAPPPPPVQPIVAAHHLGTTQILSPTQYSAEYKRGLYRSIKTRRAMRSRNFAARNFVARPASVKNNHGSFDAEAATADELAGNAPAAPGAAAAAVAGAPNQPPARGVAVNRNNNNNGQDVAELERQLIRKDAEIEDLQRRLEEAQRARDEAGTALGDHLNRTGR